MKLDRRTFLRQTSALPLAAGAKVGFLRKLGAAESDVSMTAEFDRLAEIALGAAAMAGAGYADFRIERRRSERITTREQMVRGINFSEGVGYSVRVLVEGTWGFAAGKFGVGGAVGDAVRESARQAVATASGLKVLQEFPVELEEIPSHQETWRLPVEEDPFSVPLEEKVQRLLDQNAAAEKAGANFCNSGVASVTEESGLPPVEAVASCRPGRGFSPSFR